MFADGARRDPTARRARGSGRTRGLCGQRSSYVVQRVTKQRFHECVSEQLAACRTPRDDLGRRVASSQASPPADASESPHQLEMNYRAYLGLFYESCTCYSRAANDGLCSDSGTRALRRSFATLARCRTLQERCLPARAQPLHKHGKLLLARKDSSEPSELEVGSAGARRILLATRAEKHGSTVSESGRSTLQLPCCSSAGRSAVRTLHDKPQRFVQRIHRKRAKGRGGSQACIGEAKVRHGVRTRARPGAWQHSM